MNWVSRTMHRKRLWWCCVSLLAFVCVLFFKHEVPGNTVEIPNPWLDAFGSPLKEHGQLIRNYMEEGACPTEIWLVEDLGRLGNKFLEFIGARVVTTLQKKELFVTQDFAKFFGRYFTGLTATIINETYLASRCNTSRQKWKRVSHEYFADKQRLLAPLNHSYVKFVGFPLNLTAVTWSVMFRHREVLLKEFQFKDKFMELVDYRIKQVTKGLNYSILIGIHVRRTDFYNHMIELYGKARIAGVDYFERAKAIYRERYGNPLFMVISDDIAWCARNMRAPDVVFPGRGNQDDPGWDLALLASCKHLILTYGTFGVTAAYFSGGDVIIADNFTGRPNDLNERMKASTLTRWTWLPVS